MVLVLPHTPTHFPPPRPDPSPQSAELVMKGTVPQQGLDPLPPPPPTPGFCQSSHTGLLGEHLRVGAWTPGASLFPHCWEAASRGLGSGMSCKYCSCIKHCPAWREVSLVIWEAGNRRFPSLEHWGGRGRLLEKLLFAGSR